MAAKLGVCCALLTIILQINQFRATDLDHDSMRKLMDRMSDIELENKKLKMDMKVFKDENMELKSRIEALESKDKANHDTQQKRLLFQEGDTVAFTALIKPMKVQSFNNGETIVFETVLTNLGGAYNSGDGIFVAPTKGLYMFSCSVLDDNSSELMLHAEIVVNDVPQARVFAFAERGIHRDQGAQTIFVQLNQGDHVRVRHIDEDNGTVGGELYTSFSGYLLRAFDV